MKKVPAAKVVTATEASESPLPPRIQEALGELVGAAREGLLALSVGVGLGVVHALLELEVDEVVGPKGWGAAGMLVAEQQFPEDHRLPRPRHVRHRDRASPHAGDRRRSRGARTRGAGGRRYRRLR